MTATMIYRDGALYVEATGLPYQAPLDQAKARQRIKINAQWALREQAPLTWDNSVFDATRDSMARMAAAAATTFPLGGLGWTLADDSNRNMSAVDLLAVQRAINARSITLHATARTLKARIAAATTTADVEAVAWPAS